MSVPRPALAYTHGNVSLLACPMGTSTPDGCPLTVSGTILQPNFFTTALQSGQVYTVARPPWNVAGVDYPVGPSPLIIYKDAATATYQTGCSYQAAGTFNPTGTSTASTFPRVICTHATNMDIEGIDFRANGNHGAVLLEENYPLGTTTVIKNNYFELDNNNSNIPNYSIVTLDSPTATKLTFFNNYLNGHARTLTNGIGTYTRGVGTYGGGATVGIGLISVLGADIEYNYFTEIPSRVTSGSITSGSYILSHNLIDSAMMTNNGVHGELDPVLPSSGTINEFAGQYNTLLIPADTQGAWQSPFFVSNGVNSYTDVVTDTDIDHNVIITNLRNSQNPLYVSGPSSNNATNSVAIASFSYTMAYATAEVYDNYVDNTGGFSYINCGSGTGTATTGNVAYQVRFGNHASIYGNVDMQNASIPIAMVTTNTEIQAGGTGYAVGDHLTFGNGITVTVSTVNSTTGAIMTYTYTGTTSSNAVAAQATTTGSGTGATWGPSCTGF